MADSIPELSVILPAYNEAQTIVRIIEDVLRHAPKAVEILLMDDDSPDGTGPMAREAFAGEPRVRVLVRTEDRGFAKSIRAGIEAARGDKVLVMDSDYNHDPAVIPTLLGISPYADIVSGSRFAAGGDMANTTRYLLSFLYNLLVRVVVRTQVQDNLCGYFVMDRRALLDLPLDAIFFGFGDYFFRLIYHAQRRRLSIIEVPIVLTERLGGEPKNRLLRTFWAYTRELARFRWSTWWRRKGAPR